MVWDSNLEKQVNTSVATYTERLSIFFTVLRGESCSSAEVELGQFLLRTLGAWGTVYGHSGDLAGF